jgi:hypothetical protein
MTSTHPPRGLSMEARAIWWAPPLGWLQPWRIFNSFHILSISSYLVQLHKSKCFSKFHASCSVLNCFSSLKMALTGTETVAVTVSFLLLATIVLLLRCDIRYRILKNHGAEDILVICAWVCLDTLPNASNDLTPLQVFAVPEAMLICLSAGHHESAYPQVIPYLKVCAKMTKPPSNGMVILMKPL